MRRPAPDKAPDSGSEEEAFSYFDSFFQESRGFLRPIAAVLLLIYLLVLIL